MLIRPVIYDPIRSVIRDPLGASIGFYVGQLFANGEQGAWYDPSDFSTMFQDSAGTIPVTAVEQPVGRILDKSGRGNHATQTTAAARPVLSARKNLLIRTEQFDGAAWIKSAAGTGVVPVVTPNFGIDPLGGNTADRIQLDSGAAGNSQIAQTGTLSIPATVATTFSVYLRSLSGTVNVTLFSQGMVTTAAVTTEWQQFTFPVASGSGTPSDVRIAKRDIWGTTGTADILAWGAQYEVSASATRYQRVNTTTDYDSVGFPHYLKFDGVDDFLVTGSINFTATDKMTVWAGVTKLSDAAQGIVCELSASAASNNGAFGLYAPNAAAQATYMFRSRGTVMADAIAGSLPAPNISVLSGIGDIAGDVSSIRVNASPLTVTTDQGTGNYGTYPIYIGRRAGTSLPFNGQLNQLIVRGAASTNTQIEYGEDYVASKTGVTLP